MHVRPRFFAWVEELNAFSSNTLITKSAKIAVGYNQVIKINRLEYTIANNSNPPTDNQVLRMAFGLAHSDLPEVQAAHGLGSNLEDFPDKRNDIVDWHNYIFQIDGAAVTPHDTFKRYVVDFKEPLVLPRSPSLIIIVQNNGGADQMWVTCGIHYEKEQVSSKVISQLLKLYQQSTARAQRPARVIDNVVKTPDATADIFGNIPPQQD